MYNGLAVANWQLKHPKLGRNRLRTNLLHLLHKWHNWFAKRSHGLSSESILRHQDSIWKAWVLRRRHLHQLHALGSCIWMKHCVIYHLVKGKHRILPWKHVRDPRWPQSPSTNSVPHSALNSQQNVRWNHQEDGPSWSNQKIPVLESHWCKALQLLRIWWAEASFMG